MLRMSVTKAMKTRRFPAQHDLWLSVEAEVKHWQLLKMSITEGKHVEIEAFDIQAYPGICWCSVLDANMVT